MKHKSLVVDVSATSETGAFTGYASVFNNIDSVRDVVMPGAFTETLAEYGENGANIPCYWNHVLNDPRMCIGWTLEAREDANGLFVRVQLDLGSEVGAQAYAMLKRGLVKQMSITYIVEDSEYGDAPDGGEVWFLKKLKLFEVSVVPVAANQEAEILDVKADAPRRARPSDDTGGNEKPLDSESGSEEEQVEVKAEEPETVNAEEPGPVNSRVLALATEVELATIRLSISEVIS